MMRWQLDRRGLLLLAAAWALGAVPAAAENARQILLDSLQPRVSTYVGEQVTEISGAGLPPRARLRGRQKQQVYRTARTLRIDFENGPVIFDNGESQIHYFPRQNVVERSPSNLGARRVLGVRRALASGRAEVEQLADDSLAGRAAYVISIRDTQGQKPDRKVWVDRQTGVQLRQDVIQPNGRTLSTYFTRIEFGVEPPADKQTFTPPPDALTVSSGPGRALPALAAERIARAWGGLLQARQVPPGFKFRGYYRHAFRNRPGIVAVYDGPGERNTLSVFQGPAIGMAGRQVPPGRLRILSARKGGADVVVVGPMAEDQLQRVMDSVE